MSCCDHLRPKTVSRRQAMQAVALGGGAALLTTLAPGVSRAGGHTEMLLLTCMDFRLTGAVDNYMEARGLAGKFDHVILAGASLGALNDRFPAWAEVFWAKPMSTKSKRTVDAQNARPLRLQEMGCEFIRKV